LEFGRLLTAMATPFNQHGELDEDGVVTLVNHLLNTGTTAIVAAGTTGESPTLTHEEKLRLFELTVRAVAGRVPVIAGTGSNDTAASIRLSEEAEELGVDALLQVSPYYNKPSQEGLYQHFAAIADAVNVPVILYNIPGRCSVNIELDTLMRLAQIPNIIGVKEASGDFSYVTAVAANKPDDFLLFSGDDKYTLPVMALGGAGVVSVAAHVVGPEMSEMIDAFSRGDVARAAAMNARLLGVFTALFKTTSPSPLKAALNLLGLPGGPLRLPLVEAPESVVALLQSELQRLGKLSA